MSANDPKYTFENNRIFNAASGEVIPEDEPTFLLRARDIHAIEVLRNYVNRLAGGPYEHVEAVSRTISRFMAFAADNPDRMKIPDTELTDEHVRMEFPSRKALGRGPIGSYDPEERKARPSKQGTPK